MWMMLATTYHVQTETLRKLALDNVIDMILWFVFSGDGVLSVEEFRHAPFMLGGIRDENAKARELVITMEEDIEQMTQAKGYIGKKSKKADKVLDKLIIKEEIEEDDVIKKAVDLKEEDVKMLRRRKSHWMTLS